MALMMIGTAGRIRKGPAPVSGYGFLLMIASATHMRSPAQLNLEVPQYEINEAEGKMVIG